MIQIRMKSMLAAFSLSVLMTGCSAQPAEAVGEPDMTENSEAAPESEGTPSESEKIPPESEETPSESEKIPSENNETASPGGETVLQTVEQEEPAAMEPVLLENPGVGFYLAREPETVKEHTLQLEQVYEKANAITDEEAWFEENQLDPPFCRMAGSWIEEENVPEGISDRMEDLPLTQIGFDDSFWYCVYGEKYYSGYLLRLYDRENCTPVCSLDFSEYCWKEASPAAYQWIRWARAEGNMLYVSLSHNTYSETAPDHAYIVAVDLTDMSVLWKTEPLVSNARNFELIGNEIVCGYGFTAEDDFLYQIDRDTGRILEQIPIKTMADYIIRKDDQLFVRTYNTNYVFRITE